MIPQVTMILASQNFAPTRCSSRFDGTSKQAYATKKIPAPSAYAASVRPVSAMYSVLAKPMFTRSRKARVYISKRIGTRRHCTLRMITASVGSARPGSVVDVLSDMVSDLDSSEPGGSGIGGRRDYES